MDVMPIVEDSTAYERGRRDGSVDAQLAAHTEQLRQLTASISELVKVTSDTQEMMATSAAASQAVAKAMAERRSQRARQRKVISMVGAGLAGTGTLIASMWQSFH